MLTMIFMTSFYSKKRNKDLHGLTAGFINAILPVFTLLTVTFVSCTKDPVKIGIDLLPENDFVKIYSTDTIGIKAYTMYNDELISSDSTSMIAGNIYDEYFGSTHCDFVAQLRVMDSLRKTAINIDSVFLRFIPSAVSGDTAAVHYIRLYETGTVLTDADVFYSGQDPDTIKFLGEYRMPVLKADSVYSVRLNIEVAQYLFRDTSMFKPASQFYTEFFRGLYFGIRSETKPVMMTMTSADNPLAITIYYHDAASTARSYSFVATERAVNYNRFTHDHTTDVPDKRIKHINDLFTDTAVYLQTYNGVYTRLDLPSLAAFRGTGRIGVNKARLYVPVHIDSESYPEDNMPAQIYLRYRDGDNELAIPDLVHGYAFMDGTYYKDKDYYIFNIPTFVQKYLEGEIENPSVEMFFPLSEDHNVIFKANMNNPTVRFEFAYTIY